MDILYFGYSQHACKPLIIQVEFAETALVNEVIGNLEKVLKVCDG
jgi:hypothetical protein